jgi:hypothetical protein
MNIKNRIMKYIILFTVIFLFAFCSVSTAQKKVEFDYPEDSITDASKIAFVKQFNKGKILYSITCGKCHNMKNIIPDFSLPQLMDYEMRMYPVHMERLNDTKISDEEMQKVILFLRFKKKSGIPARG